MKIYLDLNSISFENGKMLPFTKKKLSKLNYPNLKTYYELAEKILGTGDENKKNNKENPLKLLDSLLQPNFYCHFSKKRTDEKKDILEKHGLKIEWKESTFQINDKIYPNIINNYLFQLNNQKYGDNIYYYQLFYDFIPILKKKKIIYSLGTWHKEDIQPMVMGKFPPLEYLKNTGEFKNNIFKIYQLFYHSKKNQEFNLHFFPSTILSNYKSKYLKKYKENVKFDLTYIFIRKKDDNLYTDNDLLLNRFQDIQNFILQHLNPHACCLFYLFEGFSEEYMNIIAFMTQYFKKIRIFRTTHSAQRRIHLWIQCFDYQPKKKFIEYKKSINFLEKELFFKDQFYLYNIMNQNTQINRYQKVLDYDKKINHIINPNQIFEEIQPSIFLYLDSFHYPTNVVYDTNLLQYSHITLLDMNTFVDIYYKHPNLSHVIELNMKETNWLFLIGLLNQANHEHRKNIDYYLHGNYDTESENLLQLSSLPIQIYSEKKKIPKDSLIIIHEKLDEEVLYYYLNKSYICMIQKDTNLPFEDYYIYEKSENWLYLKKNIF